MSADYSLLQDGTLFICIVNVILEIRSNQLSKFMVTEVAIIVYQS